MSQFVRITNSGQIHTCEILSQIVNNGELIKLQDFFFSSLMGLDHSSLLMV